MNFSFSEEGSLLKKVRESLAGGGRLTSLVSASSSYGFGEGKGKEV
jgi:hypothetical protein